MSTASGPQTTGHRDGEIIPIALGIVKVYKGAAAAVVPGTGYGVPLVPATAADQFVGVWGETYDNTAGTAGGYFTKILRKGLLAFNSSGLTAANIGQKAYFSDDTTITNVPGTTFAGIIAAVDSAGVVWVDIENAVRTPPGVDLYSITAQVVTTNVAGAAQTAISTTIPANDLKAGDVVRLRGKLVGVTRTSTDTTAVTLNYGSTAIATLASAFAHATTNYLYFDAEFVVRTSGASGTVVANGIVSGGTAGATVAGFNMASSAIDTTAAQAFSVGVTFSANNTTDQIGVDIFDVQIVRS